MNPPQDPALRLLLDATASQLAAVAHHIDDTAHLLVPPAKRQWSGASSTAFARSLRAEHTNVILASELAAAAGRFAADAVSATGEG